MSHTIYSNFVLSNIVEDQFASRLDLQQFVTVDNGLTGEPGMIRKINRYTATDAAEVVAQGVGNTQSIDVTVASTDYTILTVQDRFKYYDEEAMTDPMLVPVGMQKLGVDLFNKMNADIYGEWAKATLVLPVASIGFDAFADAQSMLNVEDLEGLASFATMSALDMARLRKALGTDLKYVESFARSGYVGTVAGTNVYTKKNATSGDIYIATKDAVTLFNKKGTEVEQIDGARRSADDANVRLNTIFARKYYIAALTDETKVVRIAIGKTATATQDTTVQTGTTYYAPSGAGYVKVTPAAGANPKTSGWYTIA